MLDTERLISAGIDTEEGLAYCAEDPEFYEEMLDEFLRESETKNEELRRFRESSDLARYGICAHSLKSTSAMIGAKAFSEQAREMEMACKEGNEAAVFAGHEPFLKAYAALTEQIRSTVHAG